MSTNSVVFVVLIIIRIYSVLTLLPLINCPDCDILSLLINKSRTNTLSIPEDTVSELNRSSLNILDLKQRAIRNYFESAIYPIDQPRVESNLAPIRMNVIDTSTSSEFDLDTTEIQSTATMFSEMTDNENTMSTENTVPSDTATTNENTTSDDRVSPTTPLTESENKLPLILGLTLGLGMPICLVIIGGLVYYLKIYRPRQSQTTFLTN